MQWVPGVREEGGGGARTYTVESASGDHGDGSETVVVRYNVPLTGISSGDLFFRLRVE